MTTFATRNRPRVPVVRPVVLPVLLLVVLGTGLTACGGEAEQVAGDPTSSDDGTYAGTEGRAARPQAPDDLTFPDGGVSADVATATDPLSTFALDVDNGSYRIAQAYVAQGTRPPPESVRAEEWVNAFAYGDPAPTGADLAVRTESGVRPGVDGSQLVRVAVTAREVAAEERPSVNLTLVVDRSGSMGEGDRIALVKDSVALLARSLRGDDTVSVVGFDDQVELLLPPTPVSEGAGILASVDDLYPRGSTNLADGLSLGYEQARSAYRPGGINVVVLCSDGVANVGMTGPEGITARIAEAGREGIHLVTVGYGMGSYNDDLMEQLADHGDGFYRYVDTEEEAQHLYVDELTSLLAPVADDARTQVSFDPELVASYRLVGYENRAMSDQSFADLSADAGELGAGHHASALYEVRLAPGVAPGTAIGTAQVLWKTPGTDSPASASAPVLAADPATPMSDSLALATAVADLARVTQGHGAEAVPPASASDVRERAGEMAARGVPGAAELAVLAERLAGLG